MTAPRKAKAAKTAKRPPTTRLSPEGRTRQLISVAAGLLGSQGVAGLEIKEVAAVAGVTRPVVYRLFPTRAALILAVLEDFEADLSSRFESALVRSLLGGTLPDVTVAFVEACCDAIEAKGAGPWQLLEARTPDVEAARLGGTVQTRMLAPWIARIAELTGRDRDDLDTAARIVVAAGRAALDGWIEGRVSRARAIEDATRAVSAVLAAFAEARPITDDGRSERQLGSAERKREGARP